MSPTLYSKKGTLLKSSTRDQLVSYFPNLSVTSFSWKGSYPLEQVIDDIEEGCEDGALEILGRIVGISDDDAIFDGDDDISQSESLLHNGCNVIVTLATPGVVVRSIELAVIVRDLPELAKLSSV